MPLGTKDSEQDLPSLRESVSRGNLAEVKRWPKNLQIFNICSTIC